MAKSKIVKSLCTLHFAFYFLSYIFLLWVLLPHLAYSAGTITKGFSKSTPAFIENKGQIIDQNNKPNPAVLFLLNTPGFNVQLRRSGFSYDLYKVSISRQGKRQQATGSINNRASSIENRASSIEYHRIDFDLVGGNKSCPVIASGASTDYMNYYSGETLPEEMTSVHSYKEVVYRNLYPGIDLQFASSDDLPFKYNFNLHPGANIEDIRIKISGSERIKVSGDILVCKTPIEQVNEIIPECYYMSEETRIPVHARFYRINEHLYGVKTDQEWPGDAVLFIDPLPARRWGTYYGVSWSSEGSCSIDQAGDVYIAGTTTDPSNIATSGAFQSTISSYQDAFLAKFNPSGERLWGTYFGGTGSDDGLSCAVDHEGNIYLMGLTGSPGLATPGAYQTVIHGTEDGFIAKFNPSGQRIWATYYGGYDLFTDLNEEITYCTFDSLNNVYCSGLTSSPTDIATPGAYQTTIGGNYDAFLVKFTSSGVRIWATYYGGANREDNPFCTATRNGFILLSGSTTSTNNIATPGSFMPNYSGLSKSFLACFDTNGVRQWGTYFGGLTVSMDISYGCCSDSLNNIYLFGFTTSLNNIGTTGTYQPSALAPGGYLEQFSTSGSRLWGTYYGQGDVMSATTSDSGYIYICGQTAYGLQDPYIASPYAYQTLEAGNVDAFLAKFNGSGQRIWGTYYGGQVWDEGLGCAKDHSDNVYLFGFTTSPNNSSDAGPCLRSSKNNIIASQNGLYPDYFPPESVFLVKFSECYFPDTALQIYGPSSLCANSTGIVFSIDPLITAESYHWCVAGDLTITGGQGTTSIIVNVGPIMGTDTISVYGINACDTGFPKVITRRVYQRPNPQISGIDTTCTGSVNLFTTSGGKTNYQWTFSPGGILIAGGTTTDSSCSISWSIGGAQWVRLNFTDTTDCNALAPTQFDVWVITGPPVSVSISPSSNPVCMGTSVTYTAIGVNAGSSPVYHWKVNGIPAGTNSTTYSFSPNNGDIITCILTSNIACGSGNPATSNTITMSVVPFVPVNIAISPSANPVCAGTSVTFTATPTNGGSSPSYQWKVNGVIVGTNNPSYSYAPVNGDIVTCVLTSNILCPTGNPATSNTITMTVNPNLPVSISISASANPFCQGSQVAYTATPINGGTTPSYQWKVNGIGVGPNNPVYSYSPNNGDVVSCVLTSNIACPIGNPATSNSITMIVNANLPAGISITASTNPFCPGNSVTFTAIPINGGANPAYQWKVNGANAGANSPTYSYNPASGDLVSCILTSNLTCVSGNPATSNTIIMSGTLAPIVTFTLCNDTITTTNAKPFRLKGGIPLGGIYSGAGVAGGLFNPAIAGVGNHQVNYTYTNAALCSATAHSFLHIFNPSNLPCGSPLTDIRDNKVYPTVQIGSQCWMAENLNYGIMIPGNTSQRDNCIWEKYCFNDVNANCGQQTYYQWGEIMQYDETVSTQGLCPPGWHVPTEADWNTLFANYISNGFAASPLKYSGFSGFNALLAGARHLNRNWDYQGFATFFWSSSAHGTNKAWAHGMNDIDPSVSMYPAFRSNAMSVRCVKD